MAAYLAPYKWRLVVAMVAKLVASSMFLVLPAVIKSIVDTALVKQDTALLNQITVALLAVFFVLSLASVIGNYMISVIGERIVLDLRRQLYAHLNSLSMRFFTERRVGELISRMSNDVTTMRRILTDDLIHLVRYSLTIVIGVGIMIVLNWRLTLFILLTTPLVIVIGGAISRYSRRGATQVQDEIAGATIVAEEVFQNIREVKSFVREGYEVQRYNGALDRAFAVTLKLIRIRAVMGPVVDFMFSVNVALILWYGGHEVVAGRLTEGDLVAFLIYVGVIGGEFAQLSWLYTQFQETLGATRRVFELLDTPPDLQDALDARTLPPVEGRITFDDVSFAYDHEQPVLQHVNLDIAPGEIVALVGPSGAGKSTMFNLIPRFYDVTTGALCVDGIDVRAVTQASLRAQIGIVPQETLLFGGTIRENILYGRLDATEDELIEAAKAANAHAFITELLAGYETIVGERGIRLSGGQRQRVAIARAILKNPRILLLDEATSSLDNESEQLVQEALERLMQNRTTVIIAHRLSTVRVAHRIAVLEQGQIVELGTHADLIAQRGLYARLYEMQFHTQDLLAVD
jgi:subfamily B ATP-binding cassette protein MsbA